MINIHNLSRYSWVEAIDPTESELTSLVGNYQLPTKFKNYMMDRHEQPRAAYDDASDFGVLVVRALGDVRESHSTTVPIFLGFNDRVLISVCHDSEQARLVREKSGVQYHEISGHILAILAVLLTPYFDQLDKISQQAEKLEDARVRRVSKDHLNTLALMKTNLVYLRSATAGNLVALQELQETFHKKLTMSAVATKKADQQISDLLIEYQQCRSMFDVVGDVVSETESAFGNILNNKLNQTMQFLTVWSLILAIPPIISGFYGMNVKLPFADESAAWIYTVLMTLLLVGWMILHIKLNQHR